MIFNARRFLAAIVSVAMMFTSLTTMAFADENDNVSSDESIELSAAAKMTVNAGGWKESVYAEWLPVAGTAKYEVCIKKSSEADSAYKKLDDELIRQYPTYWRADAVGLAVGEYDLKISALNGDGEEIAWSIQKGIDVRAYNRTGFAFSPESTYKGAGAYNMDGTLKDNAVVLYVTKDTAKTVTADIIQDSKGGKVTFTGFQAIIDALAKGTETRPIIVRVIGTINKEDMDGFSSSAEGVQIKGRSAYSNLNLTIEGIGNDATIKGFGFLLRNAGNVEIRNLAVMTMMDDDISIDTDNCNLWVHNLDLYYGPQGSGDHAKGDGTIDNKALSTWVTFSENHIWDCGKVSLCGMGSKDEYGTYYVTYVGNWFDHSDSRHPRIRGGNIHIYNNYYDGNAKYGVGVTTGGSAFVENNYFRNCKDPMLVSLQGTDALGSGTFSGEDGGYIKEYGNVMAGKYTFITGEDAYCASSRDEKVPDTYIAKTVKAGTRYTNFDTADTMYDYTTLDANNVPTYVVSNAGRLNGGDFTWEFDNETEDTNYAVIPGLRTAVNNYATKLVAVGGTVKGTQTGGTPSSLTGIDGNVVSYQPVTKLEGLNLPNKTDQSKITAGNPKNLTSSAVEALKYDLKIETANIKAETISSNKDVTGSPGTFTIIASSEATVVLDAKKGICLGGSGNKTKRAIKFTTTDKGILYLSGSSTGSDERFLEVISEDGTVLSGTGISTSSSKAPVSLPGAGTYYVYSKGKGINVSFLGVVYGDPVVPDEPVYDDTPGFSYTSVEPGAPIKASKPSVPKAVINPDGTIEQPPEETTENVTSGDDAEDTTNNTENTTNDEVVRWGDVDENGKIEANDASNVLAYVLKCSDFKNSDKKFNIQLADVDDDDVVTAKDASLIFQKFLGGSNFVFPGGKDWNYTEKSSETTTLKSENTTASGEDTTSSENTTASGEDTTSGENTTASGEDTTSGENTTASGEDTTSGENTTAGEDNSSETTTAGGGSGGDVTDDSKAYNFSDSAFDAVSTTAGAIVDAIQMYKVAGIKTGVNYELDNLTLTRGFKFNTTSALTKEPEKSALGLTLKANDKVTLYVGVGSDSDVFNLAFVNSSFNVVEEKQAITPGNKTPVAVEFVAPADGIYYIQALKGTNLGKNPFVYGVKIGK